MPRKKYMKKRRNLGSPTRHPHPTKQTNHLRYLAASGQVLCHKIAGPLISAGGFRVTVKVAIKVDVRIAITVSS